MTTLRIHSTDLIYSPGMFRWIEQALLPDKAQSMELKLDLLAAMGIPEDFHLATLGGEYVSRTEGETLVLTFDVM
jgi:hypothetical protein